MLSSDAGVAGTGAVPAVPTLPDIPAPRLAALEGLPRPALRTGFNHAALSVTDLDRAVAWYQHVFGLKLLLGPFAISSDAPGGGPASDIYGEGWQSARIAHLVMPGGTGIELFEFTGPVAERRVENFDYWRTGIFHICFTVEKVEETAKRITLFGGRQRSKIHQVGPESWFCFCEDPFGNVLELVDQTFEQLFTPPPGVEDPDAC
ncbi:VOC family protein [Amycolatopsis sp. Hca4]|uniref:VOC family protein n=1 Tax=unclassified Amycolatopsis TaxID=2618356 RepID=UPI001590865D|nr:VOC family protein [Amycolatopsis sp. Hca4]QKV74430.1 VOC family protein [Amycolatopsis sp. Hca4]